VEAVGRLRRGKAVYCVNDSLRRCRRKNNATNCLSENRNTRSFIKCLLVVE